MMKVIGAIGVLGLVGFCIVAGCSREDRDEVMDRVGKATRALNGSDKSVPDIVRDQQRKERARQNTEWTPENQAKHPIEYCQAQLEELDKHSATLEVSSHKLAVSQSTAKRRISEDEAQVVSLQKFLTEAKAAYRAAEAANKWPMKVNGFELSQEKAQEKIVEAAHKIAPAKKHIATQKSLLAALEKRSSRVTAEKKKVVALRERIQTTLNDLNTKKVIEGEKGVADALNAINDSMGAIGTDTSDPSIEDLMTTSESASREASFREIMAEP